MISAKNSHLWLLNSYKWKPPRGPTFGDLLVYLLVLDFKVMIKLYHYCVNNQKTDDPGLELMLFALESMVDTITIKHSDQAGDHGWLEFTPLDLILYSAQRWN